MQNPLKKVCEDDDDSNGGISIYNIGGVFIVIFVGIGLAIVTLVIEYWCVKLLTKVYFPETYLIKLNFKGTTSTRSPRCASTPPPTRSCRSSR